MTHFCSVNRLRITDLVVKKISSFLRQNDSSNHGYPTDRFGKLSVRKALNPLQFSEGNFHFELS